MVECYCREPALEGLTAEGDLFRCRLCHGTRTEAPKPVKKTRSKK